MIPPPESIEEFHANHKSKKKDIFAVDEASQSFTNQPTQMVAAWQRGRKPNNQFIPANINHEREAFIPGASLLARSGAFLEVQNFLVSPDYNASFIWAETLEKWGWDHVQDNSLKRVFNPRGGGFQPIGVAVLYAKLPNVEPFYIKLVFCLSLT